MGTALRLTENSPSWRHVLGVDHHLPGFGQLKFGKTPDWKAKRKDRVPPCCTLLCGSAVEPVKQSRPQRVSDTPSAEKRKHQRPPVRPPATRHAIPTEPVIARLLRKETHPIPSCGHLSSFTSSRSLILSSALLDSLTHPLRFRHLTSVFRYRLCLSENTQHFRRGDSVHCSGCIRRQTRTHKQSALLRE